MRLFVAVVLLVLCSSALGGVARPKPASQGGPDDALLKEIAAARENAKTFAKELPALQDFAKRVRSLKLADVVSVRVELDSEPDANKKKGANGANKKNGANGANKKNGATKKSNPFIVVIAFAKEYAKDTKLDVISKDMVALKDKISKEVSKIDDLPFVVEIRQSTKNVPLSSAMLERAELVRRGRIQSLAQAGRGRQQARSQVKTRAPPAFIAGSLWLRSCPETRNAPGAGSAGGILIDGANNYYLMSNFHVIDYNLCYNMAPTRAKEAPTVFGPGDANHAPRGTQLADMLDVTGKTGAGTNNRAATRNPYVHILDNSHDYGNLQDDGGFDVAVAKIAAGSQVSCQHKVFSNLGVISRATIAGTHASNRVNDIFMRVVKFGMRTGWTEGIIASEEGQNVHVRGYWPTFPRNGGAGESADMSNKKPADFKCTDDACASIVDSADRDDARLKGWNSAVFAGPGDSGSWVFDDNHNAYGILHSIRWELVSGIWVSYTNVYPMTDVLAALNSRHNRNYQVCTDNRANFAA